MSARTSAPAGWVTVAAAAAALTRAGDKIDASNVSRYLARNSDIPSRKDGRCRFVDLAALMAHRNTSVFVGDKRQARDLVDAMIEPTAPARRAAAPAEMEDEDERAPPAGSELSQANLELKRLQVREKQLEMRVREGELIEAAEVQAVLAGVVRTLFPSWSVRKAASRPAMGAKSAPTSGRPARRPRRRRR